MVDGGRGSRIPVRAEEFEGVDGVEGIEEVVVVDFGVC